MVVYLTFNLLVVRSNRTRPTSKNKSLCDKPHELFCCLCDLCVISA